MRKLDESDVARIVARAYDLGPRERPAFLRMACTGDPEALQRILRDHPFGGDRGAIESEDPRELSGEWEVDRSGQVLGSWRLLHRIGGGGMSDVYLAERCDEYQQQVAVKLLRPGLVSRADHNRLKAERQILARLNHRNIARLLDGGTTDQGVPYLVMEYVDGEPIDAYCEKRNLPIRERLALFRGVCAAVHAAHQNLVIHRDLKPSNILVTKDRTLKLLDFGIAKLLGVPDSTHTIAVTHASVRLFTPASASPEQVTGDPVTTATDVYLLGILLYELLCGSRPFRLNNIRLSEIERVICHEIPPPPSFTLNARGNAQDAARIEAIARARQTPPARLRRELSGDLDNIVMMAIRKEPTRRYASVDELAADIKRYDNRTPVIACHDTWRYRTEKFLRRHALSVAAGGALAVLLTIFAVTMGVQMRRVAQSQALAEEERHRSNEMAQFLVGLFKESDPSESRGEQMTAREILERGAERIASLNHQPEEQATLRETIGRAYLSIGSAAKARPQLEAALATRRKLFKGDHAATASSLGALGKLELADGHMDVAEKSYTEALAMNERLFGLNHVAVATALEDLGQLQKMKGDLPKAEDTLRQSLVLYSRLSGEESQSASSVMNELAQVLERKGDFAGAEDLYRRAIEIDKKTLGTDHPQVAHNLHNLAVVLQERGDYAAARPYFEQSLLMFRKVLGEKHPDTLEALGNYGRYLQDRGELAEAEKVLREALTYDIEARGKDHVQVGYDHVSLGYLLERRGEFSASEAELREALRIYKTGLTEKHVYVASARTGLGQTLMDLGKVGEGLQEANQALEIWRANVPGDDAHIANTQAIIAHGLALQGKFDQAEPLLSASYERMRATLGFNDQRTQRASSWLAEVRNRTVSASN
ncbi:MAG TPA: serine/threonine-protein kinase [Steroidobacteraceae bacterium]|jgi:serine/threonine-protein kinase